MAMKIDSQYAPLKVQARHFEKIMIDNDINYTAFKKNIAHQINELPNIVTEVSKSIENNIGNTISNIVTANCNKLKDIFGLNN